MNKIISTLAVTVVSLALSAPLYAQTSTPVPSSAPGAIEHGAPQEMPEANAKGHKEHHPEIHHAIHALEKAKKDLEHAAHDYDGHRAKALEHVDAALQELHAALESVKK